MKVILVDSNNNKIGELDKLEAHKIGKLHRAFSIFIFNSKNELLLQKRSNLKYHSANLWTNTCCSHPINDNILTEAKARLKEEMGLECELKLIFSFIYKANFDNGLIEHEYDHVFFGRTDNSPVPNKNEVSDWKYISLDKLKTDITNSPDNYTEWLKICMNKVIQEFKTFS